MKPLYLSPFCPLAVILLFANSLVAAIETTSATDASATASISGDLLETSLSSTNWPCPSGNNTINNGTTGTFNENSDNNPALIILPETYDFTLDLVSNPDGYDISEINCFTGWNDGRAGQAYTVFFSIVGSSEFTQITSPAVSVSASGQSLVTRTFDNMGGLLGSGVDVVRFVVDSNALSNVWREIDVIGSGTISLIDSFTADSTLIIPSSPLTLSWEVDSNASISIDQGIGEINSLTNPDGTGSITINPGPSLDTTYTLSATSPAGIGQASIFVGVSDRPVINAFTGDSSFVNPGSSVNLSWEVAGATSLFLNGVDVTGLTETTVTPLGQSDYTLTAINENGSTVFEKTLFALSSGGAIISEILASNDSILLDEDGDDSDWIELHNPTASDANLEGYYLTDDAEDLQKWRLPVTTLSPGEFLVVFASNKDRAVSGGELHTNFSLSAGGEYLALVEPDGVTIATEFTPEYPELRTNVSYGYDFGEQGYRFFLEPTPNATSGESFLGFVEDTSFSVDRGFYTDPFSLEITTLTEGATIYYTLDGSEPDTVDGLIYGPGPLSINETTVLRAAAFKSGFESTNIDTQTYIFPADVLTQPEMRPEITQDSVYGPQLIDALSSIPTIALSFDGDDIDRNETPISVELLNFESEAIQLDAGAARFGSFNTNFAKRSFRLHFRSIYGPGRLNYPLYNDRNYEVPPVESFNSLDIRAGNHDMVRRGAYLGNRFADDSMIEMGHVAPHGRFVHIYFNGEYRGQYHLRERWDADMLSDYLPGEEEEFDTINANNAGRQFRTGDLQNGDLIEWDDIQDRLVDTPRFTEVRDMLNLNNYIDFMLLFTYGTCESEFRAGGSVSNGVGFTFFLKDADGFLQPPNGNSLPPGGIYPADHNGPLNAMTLLREEADPDFMILLADRIHRQLFNDGALTPTASSDRLRLRVDESRLSYISELARWGSHNGRTNRLPEAWESYHDHFFDTEFPVLTDQRFALLEAAGMYPDIVAPTYSQHGGALSPSGLLALSVPESVSRVYYMFGTADTDPDQYVNSLDPRLPGGGINPLANVANFEAGPGPVDFIQSGDSWRFLDDGSNQGTAWREESFNDSLWSSGISPLGYGDGQGQDPTQSTLVSFGPDADNRHITTYFRRTFTVDDPNAFELLNLSVRRDDGVVVYLNGTEILRDNLPEGTITNSTLANSAISNAAETTFLQLTLDPSAIQIGNNTLAVEIHQVAPNSSDIAFDLTLEGISDASNINSIDLVVDEPGWLLSRSFNPVTGEWSALNEAQFTLDSVPANASNLVVSKIHFNPADPSEAELAAILALQPNINIEDIDSDEFEFLELKNVGSQAINLEGVTISGGITFTFAAGNDLPAGARLVVVENQTAFAVRYSSVLGSIAFGTDASGGSQYGGSLSNGGEQLILTDNSGVIIHDFAYDDRAPWPTASDGGGYALVLKNPTIPIPVHRVGTNWAASAEIGGSPGNGSEFGFIGDPLADNDNDGLQALIEYALGSSDSVANDTTIVAGFETFTVGEEDNEYLTISFLRNLHSQNAVEIIPQVSTDLGFWQSAPEVVLVSETDNDDGTATMVFRSSIPISENQEGQEFIRVEVRQ